ncbi:MAG: plastocyanin/azurin family copper-binding protein [Gemmatimonadota bacterium]
MRVRIALQRVALGVAVTLAACSRGSESKVGPSSESAAAVAEEVTGKVITIEMITDETGNYFKPKFIEAHPGDVLRFTLGVGVHNVHFLPDSNPGVPNLPAASELLQLPGQTFDVPVNFAAGKTYYFQCDPHAPLGMTGHVKVEAGD